MGQISVIGQDGAIDHVAFVLAGLLQHVAVQQGIDLVVEKDSAVTRADLDQGQLGRLIEVAGGLVQVQCAVPIPQIQQLRQQIGRRAFAEPGQGPQCRAYRTGGLVDANEQRFFDVGPPVLQTLPSQLFQRLLEGWGKRPVL